MEMQQDVHPSLITSKAAIVPELVMLFLEYAWDQDPHNKFFLDYSLVCSTWRYIAQHILFTSVVLRTYDAARTFLQVVQRNPALSQSTKVLNISCDVVHPKDRTAFEIISACPRLYQLIIGVWTYVDNLNLIELLNEHTYATLKALSLTIHSDYFYDRGTDGLTLCGVFTFLCKFSSLSHLTLPGIRQIKLSQPTNHPSLTPSFKLYELNLQQDPESLRILDLGSYWDFLSQAEQDIHDLEIRDICLDFLEHRGSGLHSLRLWMEPETILRAKRPLSITCPNLRELILPNCSLPDTVKQVLPVTDLEHLDFRQEFKDEDKETSTMMAEWIISLPRIRHITVRSNIFIFRGHLLREMCIQGGIQFHSRSIYDRSLSPEDPIEVSHFPRMQTIINRGRMTIPSSS